jgi:hypothetical protein
LRDDPGVEHGQGEPHDDEADRRMATDVGIVGSERPFAVEPEAEHRSAQAADHVGRLHRHHPFAQRQHQAVLDQPLQQADDGVAA